MSVDAGIFGFVGICLAMIPLNYIHAVPPFADNSRGTMEATVDALIQIGNSGRLLMAIIGEDIEKHTSTIPDAQLRYSEHESIVNSLIRFNSTGMTVSIAFFNFAGLSVTKEISATTRMVLDSVRTLVIWIFSLALKWQDFHYLQVIILHSLHKQGNLDAYCNATATWRE